MIAELHRFFVHFPVALYTTAFVIETIRLFKKDIPGYFAVMLVCGGAIIGVISGLSGNLAAHEAETIAGITPILENHELAGNIMIWFGLISSFILTLLQLKNKTASLLRWVIVLMLCSGVIITAFWGARLVRDFGAGTTLIYSIP